MQSIQTVDDAQNDTTKQKPHKRQRLWGENKHHLDKMDIRDLTIAYFRYPDILVYLLLCAVASTTAFLAFTQWWQLAIPAVFAVVSYPLAWHLLHRHVLHSQLLYRSKHTAAAWARIHYAHHQDPHDLRVLFGALYTTLPTLALVTMPVGWLIGGLAGLAAAFAAGVGATLFYEYCHCMQHLRFVPKWKWIQRIKRNHLMHHFRNENYNFGITNYFWDKVSGTFRPDPASVPRSETVFNIGYTREMQQRYPWVAELASKQNLTLRTIDSQHDASTASDGHQTTAINDKAA